MDEPAFSYQVLALALRRRIQAGEWPVGSRIPTVRVLEKAYPYSRATLHKALRLLVTKGYLDAVRGSGTYVKAARVCEKVAILAGGDLGGHNLSPLSLLIVDLAAAYLVRLGFEPRTYRDDRLSPTRLPPGLHEDLENDRLAGLLTVHSSFAYKFMRSPQWARKPVPHVDIGSVDCPHRVYVDFLAFFRQGIGVARERGCSQIHLVNLGTGLRDSAFGSLLTAHPGLVRLAPLPKAAEPDAGQEELGFHLVEEMVAGLLGNGAPTALVVPEDIIAKGVVLGALAHRIRIPEELLIIVLNNRGLRVFYPVPVVSLELDVEAMVEHAGSLLMDIIGGRRPIPRTILLPPGAPAA